MGLFVRPELPTAASMIELAEKSLGSGDFHPFQEYLCYWAAFNNIYAIVAYTLGKSPELKILRNGTVEVKPLRDTANIKIAKVKNIPLEEKQISLTLKEFSFDLRHQLISHTSTNFFVYRTPKWERGPIQFDGFGQKLNGVLNIQRTVDPNYPVWSPINITEYEQYIYNNEFSYQESLTKQVVSVLYTVRNNLFHGSKNANDANDVEVVKQAIPLLKMIVSYFVN